MADRSASTRWAFRRDFGRTRVLVVDSRAARCSTTATATSSREEWNWIVDRSREEVDTC
jgi:hypothetical protein